MVGSESGEVGFAHVCVAALCSRREAGPQRFSPPFPASFPLPSDRRGCVLGMLDCALMSWRWLQGSTGSRLFLLLLLRLALLVPQFT